MGRRNKKQLEDAIAKAQNKKEKALAYYKLGLFHDNNAREVEAIPNYLKALKIGLDLETKTKSLAWLASSYYKTNQLLPGLSRCRASQKITKNKGLKKFLGGLEKRIIKSLRR
jgi:hypothetical protein